MSNQGGRGGDGGGGIGGQGGQGGGEPGPHPLVKEFDAHLVAESLARIEQLALELRTTCAQKDQRITELEAALTSGLCSAHQQPDPLNCPTCNKVSWLENANKERMQRIAELGAQLKGYIGCRCQNCGRCPAEVSTLVLNRINPKGELGLWLCTECGPR